MTTNLEERIEYWENRITRKGCRITKWKIIREGLTRSQAQKIENVIAEGFGCESGDGGDNPDDENAKWSVYKFTYK